MGFKVGNVIVVSRKPKSGEPLEDYWEPYMDSYIKKEGKVIGVTQDTATSAGGAMYDVVEVEHDDGSVYQYPYYCLLLKGAAAVSGPTAACSCEMGALMLRGCRCGAMTKEKSKV